MLAFVDKFERGARARVSQRMPPDVLEALATSPRTSWFEIERDHHLVDAICAEFGPARAVACWKASIPDLIDKPLLHGFVSGMLGLFGRDPSRVVSLLPKGWGLVFRDLCTLTLGTPDRTGINLAFHDVHPTLARYPNYFHSFDGICQGVLSVATPRGVVSFEVSNDRSSALARFSW
jgi:hypothetical protein